MDFQQFQARTTTLAGQAYRPGMTANYITHLSSIFTSPKSMRNYVSGVLCLHKQLSLAPEAFDSF